MYGAQEQKPCNGNLPLVCQEGDSIPFKGSLERSDRSPGCTPRLALRTWLRSVCNRRKHQSESSEIKAWFCAGALRSMGGEFGTASEGFSTCFVIYDHRHPPFSSLSRTHRSMQPDRSLGFSWFELSANTAIKHVPCSCNGGSRKRIYSYRSWRSLWDA